MSRGDSIARLIEKRQKLVDSSRNRDAQALFVRRTPEIVNDKFREIPRPLVDTGGKIPVVLCLDRPLFGKLLGFPLDRYYQNPEVFLENQLRMDIFHLENVQDDQFFDESIPVWGGPGFEATLFGMRQEYSPDNEPWLRHDPIIDGPESLAQMPEADFQTSGPMPAVLEFHKRLQELLDGSGLRPIPPGWIRGPLGVAEELRGIDNLVLESLIDPEFVHAIIRYVAEFRKKWCAMRATYLGCEHPPKGLMYNDEVQIPMISPDIYRDIVLPYERELHDYHNGLHYWHSCGDATPFMPLVAELPDIDMVQCGAFSDPEKVVSIFCQRSALEIAVRPQEDFIDASDEAMKSRLEYLVELCREYDVKAALIRLTAYESENLSAHETLSKTLRWVEIAQQVTRSAM